MKFTARVYSIYLETEIDAVDEKEAQEKLWSLPEMDCLDLNEPVKIEISEEDSDE